MAGDPAGTSEQPQPIDPVRHHLFDPVPRDSMRELNTDRPDQTDSPYTVDAGHFQAEIGLVGAEFDRNGDQRTTSWGSSLNLKAGLLHNVDVQFIVDPYGSERSEDESTGNVIRASGFRAFQTRLKINLWGNDGGSTALGIMPFVQWPIRRAGQPKARTEGGVIVPLAVALPAGWSMGMMTEFDFVADDAGAYDTEYFNTITLGHDLIGGLGGYLEFASRVSPGTDDDWAGQIGLGFTYALDANTQLDLGCNFGVTDPAPDFNPFLGLTLRF